MLKRHKPSDSLLPYWPLKVASRKHCKRGGGRSTGKIFCHAKKILHASRLIGRLGFGRKADFSNLKVNRREGQQSHNHQKHQQPFQSATVLHIRNCSTRNHGGRSRSNEERQQGSSKPDRRDHSIHRMQSFFTG